MQREKTSDIITFEIFEEGDLLYETRDDAKSDDESSEKRNDDSIITPLISEEETYVFDSGDESDDKPMSKEMLEDIHERSQYHTNVNSREARYKICDHIKKRQT